MCDQHRFFFEFDKAFTRQLIEKFEASPAHLLTEDVAPPEKGVYALYRKRRLVYAGKALDTTLKRRLAEHARKISGRRNIDPTEMTCRFLIIESDWFVRAGEHARPMRNVPPTYLLRDFINVSVGIGPGRFPTERQNPAIPDWCKVGVLRL